MFFDRIAPSKPAGIACQQSMRDDETSTIPVPTPTCFRSSIMSPNPLPPTPPTGKLHARVNAAAHALERANLKLVLAESCTAGLVAGLLGGVPGISRFLCGSMVVYQEATKRAWLDIPDDLLAEFGTVAAEISEALAASVLERTPAADLAVAVTGHLGPAAPEELDGKVFVAIRFRDGEFHLAECRLPPAAGSPESARCERQRLAVEFVLDLLQEACHSKIASEPPSREVN